MFALNAYLDKVYDVIWQFPPHYKDDLEKTLYVEFEHQQHNQYKIKKIRYTVVDILLGLEEMKLTIDKTSDNIIIKIIDYIQ